MRKAHKNRWRGLSYITRRDKLKYVKIFKPRLLVQKLRPLLYILVLIDL